MKTIEEFLKDAGFDLSGKIQTNKAKIAMKNAITDHVEAALVAAADFNPDSTLQEKTDHILSAYPLTNIK